MEYKPTKTIQMKDLSKREKKAFDELMQSIGKSLIGVMKIAEIPNYIQASFECDGEYYLFRIDKLKQK